MGNALAFESVLSQYAFPFFALFQSFLLVDGVPGHSLVFPFLMLSFRSCALRSWLNLIKDESNLFQFCDQLDVPPPPSSVSLAAMLERVKKGDKRAIFEMNFSEHELCLTDIIEAAYHIALRVEGPTGSSKNQKLNKGSEDKSENMSWRRAYLLMSKKGRRSRRRFGRGDGAGKGDQQGDQVRLHRVWTFSCSREFCSEC
ncbi:hypothetical protein CQW23_11842 [Capsicum baccatum]|uniref:Uncharacterized protein n=1 Tax=Capsicum baccatum TaxID=33114 RepID=A0A2G2WQW3_CAPBA|nr:hypothetical protein CQW23_11842 [Capsicum baccatum]